MDLQSLTVRAGMKILGRKFKKKYLAPCLFLWIAGPMGCNQKTNKPHNATATPDLTTAPSDDPPNNSPERTITPVIKDKNEEALPGHATKQDNVVVPTPPPTVMPTPSPDPTPTGPRPLPYTEQKRIALKKAIDGKAQAFADQAHALTKKLKNLNPVVLAKAKKIQTGYANAVNAIVRAPFRAFTRLDFIQKKPPKKIVPYARFPFQAVDAHWSEQCATFHRQGQAFDYSIDLAVEATDKEITELKNDVTQMFSLCAEAVADCNTEQKMADNWYFLPAKQKIPVVNLRYKIYMKKIAEQVDRGAPQIRVELRSVLLPQYPRFARPFLAYLAQKLGRGEVSPDTIEKLYFLNTLPIQSALIRCSARADEISQTRFEYSPDLGQSLAYAR